LLDELQFEVLAAENTSCLICTYYHDSDYDDGDEEEDNTDLLTSDL
jgi:hypothetical protein